MLVEFSVENYKSFKDRATLSMVAAKIKSDDPQLDEDALIPMSNGLELLRCAGIYGANASGKSNFIKALQFVRYFVQNSTSDAIKPTLIEVDPFGLNTETLGKPSVFEIVFTLKGLQYRYGFEVDQTRVVAEWLFYRPKKRETMLFGRNGQDIQTKGALIPDPSKFISLTVPKALFLSVLAQFNNSTATEILNWFGKLKLIGEVQENFKSLVIPYLTDAIKCSRVSELIRQFDLSIGSVFTVNQQIASNAASGLHETMRQSFVESLVGTVFASHMVFDSEGHPTEEVFFDTQSQESEGTRKLIALAPIIDEALQSDGICVIDEIDARLHPLITRAIVQLFNSRATNPNGAQLIFVTHDTNLLDKSFLRRDQIWFAEKDSMASTHLVSLVEFKPRYDAAYEKNYLQGRYGGIPFIGDLNLLPGAENAD